MSDAAPLSETKLSLLEKYLHGGMAAPSASLSISPRDSNELIPLSYAQEQVWLHAQMAPEVPLYNEALTIHHRGPLDVAVLERSFNEILRRHEAWRTSFSILGEQPVQAVHPTLTISMPVVDLRSLPEKTREREAVRIATEDARMPLNLTQVPLFRTKLIQLSDFEYRLYLTLHHIIFDGVAIYRVLLPELAALYAAFAAGKPSPLPLMRIQYADYACWQRRLRMGHLSNHLDYWRRQLGGELPVLNLLTDRPRPAVQTFRGSMVPFVLTDSLTKALKAFAQREQATLFQTLLTGFAVLLYQYSGQEDISIGSVTAGRDRPETQAMLGYFLNTVVLRIDLSENPGFRELLVRVRNVTLEALEHDCVPFGELVRELRIQRDPSRSPLFQILFSLEPPLPELGPSWGLTQMDVDTGATKYDLYLELDERHKEILARFHYSTDLFDASTIARMAGHWQTILEELLANPEMRVSAANLVKQPEYRLSRWSGTSRLIRRFAFMNHLRHKFAWGRSRNLGRRERSISRGTEGTNVKDPEGRRQEQ